MKILENPADKKFVWSITFFCQLDFLIPAFLWPRNFYSRTPDLFHTLQFILHVVLFFFTCGLPNTVTASLTY